MSSPQIHQQTLRDSNGDLGLSVEASGKLTVSDKTLYGGLMMLATSFENANNVYIPELDSEIERPSFDEYSLTQVVANGNYTLTDITTVTGVSNTKLTVTGPLTQTPGTILAIHEPLTPAAIPELGISHWDFWRMYKITPWGGTPVYGVLSPAIPSTNYSSSPVTFGVDEYFDIRGNIEDIIDIDGDGVYTIEIAAIPAFPVADATGLLLPTGNYFMARTISGSSAMFNFYLAGSSVSAKVTSSPDITTSSELESFLATSLGQSIFDAIDSKYKTSETFAATYDIDISIKKACYKALKNNACISERIKRSREFVLWQELDLIQSAIPVLSEKEAWDDVVDCINRGIELTANIA